MKTQDVSYLNLKAQQEAKVRASCVDRLGDVPLQQQHQQPRPSFSFPDVLQKVERMRSSLHMLGAARPSSHKVFVDGVAEAKKFRPEEFFDTAPELLDRTYNRPRREQIESDALVSGGPRASDLSSKLERKKVAAYRREAVRSRCLGVGRRSEHSRMTSLPSERAGSWSSGWSGGTRSRPSPRRCSWRRR